MPKHHLMGLVTALVALLLCSATVSAAEPILRFKNGYQSSCKGEGSFMVHGEKLVSEAKTTTISIYNNIWRFEESKAYFDKNGSETEKTQILLDTKVSDDSPKEIVQFQLNNQNIPVDKELLTLLFPVLSGNFAHHGKPLYEGQTFDFRKSLNSITKLLNFEKENHDPQFEIPNLSSKIMKIENDYIEIKSKAEIKISGIEFDVSSRTSYDTLTGLPLKEVASGRGFMNGTALYLKSESKCVISEVKDSEKCSYLDNDFFVKGRHDGDAASAVRLHIERADKINECKQGKSPKTEIKSNSNKGDIEVRLEAVKKLLDQGLISESEAAKKRQEILDSL